MTFSKSTLKAHIFKLFYPTVSGMMVERRFPIALLSDAASVAKKIREGATETKLENGGTTLSFSEDPVELTVGETLVVKGMIDGITDGIASEAEVIGELKELFK